LEANATSKEKMAEWESLTLMWKKEYFLVTQVLKYKEIIQVLQLEIKKNLESINVTIDETSRLELKEEENESMEQLYEEEAEDEK
jgi:hypothetical protein